LSIQVDCPTFSAEFRTLYQLPALIFFEPDDADIGFQSIPGKKGFFKPMALRVCWFHHPQKERIPCP
jgi:hypothetical protein